MSSGCRWRARSTGCRVSSAPAAMGDALMLDGGTPRADERFGGLSAGATVGVEHDRLEPGRGEGRGPAPEGHGDARVTHRVRVVVDETHQRGPMKRVGLVSQSGSNVAISAT